MTLSDLIKEAKDIGNQFNTWDIPLTQDVHFDLALDNNSNYIIVVKTK